MDPDTCLEELRKLLAKYKQQKDNLDEADVQDLVVHAEAIDDWMSKGGAAPLLWSMNSNATKTRRFTAEDRALATVQQGLAKFNSDNPEFPGKRSIEDFYEAVRTLDKAGRIR